MQIRVRFVIIFVDTTYNDYLKDHPQRIPIKRQASGSIREDEDDNFDTAVLLSTTGFNFVNTSFVFYAGVAHVISGDSSNFPGWNSILFALLCMTEVTVLLIFLIEMKSKVSCKSAIVVT